MGLLAAAAKPTFVYFKHVRLLALFFFSHVLLILILLGLIIFSGEDKEHPDFHGNQCQKYFRTL